MNNQIQSHKPFSIWAKETRAMHPEIIDHWLKGSDLYKRAMAKTIIEAAGEA